jgi:hypothetical protein
MTPKKESRPSDARTAPGTHHHQAEVRRQSTVLHGHDRVEPLDAEDRADLAVLEAAAERGYRLATQCMHCGHWVSNPKSVRLHAGPRCRAKAA